MYHLSYIIIVISFAVIVPLRQCEDQSYFLQKYEIQPPHSLATPLFVHTSLHLFLPVSGKEKNRGNMIHHELPGEVITCNIHPMQRKNKAVITFFLQK